MKESITIFLLIGLCLSCSVQQPPPVFIGNWDEKTYDFTESIQFQESNDLHKALIREKWRGSAENYQWLRNSNNLRKTFNILQKIGLETFLSKEGYTSIITEGKHWNGLSLNEVVNTLIKTYNLSSDSADYFEEFWNRRKKENTDAVVLHILLEINTFYNYNGNVPKQEQYPGTDLYDLIYHNVLLNDSDSTNREEITLDYFQLLVNKGLNHSAYNLLHEVESTKQLILDRDSLIKMLPHDTLTEDVYWNTRNNAQWIRTYRDNGP